MLVSLVLLYFSLPLPPPSLSIKVSGYISEEKEAIAQNYLIPQASSSSGLEDGQVVIETDALQSLIKWYCRESGVRNLQKHIEKVNKNDINYKWSHTTSY